MTGFATWLVAGLVAFGIGRVLRRGKAHAAWIELTLMLLVALLGGMAATALDFGGWAEADARAFAFAFLAAVAVLGLFRVFRIH